MVFEHVRPRNERRAPSADRMERWLLGARVVRSDGSVLSWEGDDAPGYPYPEAAALLLSWLVREGRAREAVAHRIAARLARDVGQDGGIGKAGRTYAFDAALASDALLLFAEAAATGEALRASLAAKRYLLRALEERVAVRPPPPEDARRWSDRCGPHLAKAALALGRHAERGCAESAAACERLLEAVLAVQRSDGRFPTSVDGRTYVHAHAYALEGLVDAHERGVRGLHDAVRRGVAWLASTQREDGGQRAWHDGRSASGPVRTDVVAQTARLFLRVDVGAYGRRADCALAYLAGTQSAVGGVPYEPGHAHRCTWSTLFAVHAARDRARAVLPRTLF